MPVQHYAGQPLIYLLLAQDVFLLEHTHRHTHTHTHTHKVTDATGRPIHASVAPERDNEVR